MGSKKVGVKIALSPNYSFVENCTMENCGRKNQFRICSRALIPWALFP
jgi:hypothetical protein